MYALVNIHPEEDFSLSDIFIKVTETSIKALFNLDEELSGYQIFKSIEDSASTQKSDAEIEMLYIQWTPINRTNNDSIRAFVERVQTDPAQFDGTNNKSKFKDLSIRWRRRQNGQ